MPIKCEIGGTDVSTHFRRIDAAPTGPGAIGNGTLYLDQTGGGLDLRFGEEVKVWRTFNDAGAGVADHGRLFGGIVADRETSHVRNIKTWAIPCQSYNILQAKIVRDAAAAKEIALSAAAFDAQIAQLILIIQRNGGGSVAKTISTTQVANLDGSCPAVTLPPGKSLGWYLSFLCNAVHDRNPAVFPAHFIDTERTFGVGDVFGGATLHIYDASLTPAPLYAYHTDPTGAQRQMWDFVKRGLKGAAVVNRRQLKFREGEVVATYAETASGATYPNLWINHGLNSFLAIDAVDAGYWMAEPVDDGGIERWSNAESAIKADVQRTAYPRETVQFKVAEQLHPGDVITVINDLEGINQNMRVVEAKWNWQDDAVTPWVDITCGARLLRLGETGEGIPVPPTEGDVTPPAKPTWAGGTAWIIQNEQEPDNELITLEIQTTLAEPGDMSHYIWKYAFGADPTDDDYIPVRTEATVKNLVLEDSPERTPFSVYVSAYDTTGNFSGWSAEATLDTAPIRFYPAPPNMSFETADPIDPTRLYGWTPTANGTSEAKRYGLDRQDGHNCLRLKHDGSNTPSELSGLFPIVDDTPQTYYWTLYAKASLANDDITIRIRYYDEDGVETGDIAVGTGAQNLSTTWAPYEYTITSPGLGAKWAALYLAGGALGTNQFAYIDAMHFGLRLPDEAIGAGQVKAANIGAGAVLAANLGLDYLAVSANTTLDSTHFAVGVDASGAARTITLPAASGLERIYAVKKTDSSTNAVTIDGNASETIDGATTYLLLDQYDSIIIQADGTNWKVLSSHLRRPKYYDGTRWLSIEEKALPWTFRPSEFMGYTTSGIVDRQFFIPTGKTYYLTRLTLNPYVATTNNGSNYWTLALLKLSTGGDLVTGDTSGGGADTTLELTTITSFTGNPFTRASAEGFAMQYRTTGSPGPIYPVVDLWAREVLT